MNRFYALRAQQGLTQEQLADGAGISRATIIRLETLRDPNPRADIARRLADFYGMSVAQLLGLDDREAA